MTSRDAPLRFLSKLAPHLASRWGALGRTWFAGELSLATDNSVYRFRSGVFVSRAKRPARSFEAPRAMRGMTSPTTSLTLEEPDPRPQPEPEPWITRQRLGVRRPPSFRMPLPPSMTRIHHAPARSSER